MLKTIVDGVEVSVRVTDPRRPARLRGSFRRFTGRPLEARTGTGMDLAIVERSVELIGGRVQIETKLNEGSTFSPILKRNLTSVRRA